MKKICFLVDSIFSIGGVQRVTAVIAKALATDYEITIVTFDNPSKEDTSMYNLHTAAIQYIFFKYPQVNKWKKFCCKAYSAMYRKVLPQTKITSDWYSHSSFPSELRDAVVQELKGFDIIVGVHAPLATRLASCKPFLRNTKLIGWIHNSYEALFSENSRYIGPDLRKHCEFQLQKLHHTIVLCQYDALQYSFPTKVIYNPLTLIPGDVSQGTSKKFLAVGRFSHQHKGFDLLIKAFNIFSSKNEEWTLDIVGEGVEKLTYKKLIKDYQLEDRIHIHPFTNKIQKYYSDAQVYVLSSRWEGMPLVLMEAMSHGLPIISSELPVCLEIMCDFGLYFENGNVEELAQRLEEATHLDWKKKSKEALDIAKRFNLDVIVEQWKQIIEE